MALTLAQMTTNLQIHLRAAGTVDMKRCTVHSRGPEERRAIRWTVWPRAFLWGTWGDSPQPSHTQIHRVNSLRRRGGGEAFSPNGVHKGGRPAAIRRVCTFVHSVCTGLWKPNLLEVKVLKKFGYHTDKKPEGRVLTLRQINCALKEGTRGKKYGRDLMPQQRGLIDPNYKRVKASAKCYSSNVGAKPPGTDFFRPRGGRKAC